MVELCPKHGLRRDKSRRCPLCRKESRLRNKEQIRFYSKKYCGENKEKTKASRMKASKKYQQKCRNTPNGRVKNRARDAVTYAIKTGKLIKLPCQVCGSIKVEAHHYLGYAEEHRLNVIFLCPTHHRLADLAGAVE